MRAFAYSVLPGMNDPFLNEDKLGSYDYEVYLELEYHTRKGTPRFLFYPDEIHAFGMGAKWCGIDSLEGYDLLVRSFGLDNEDVFRTIEILGGRPYITLKQYSDILLWPRHVSKDFTLRNIGETTMAELSEVAYRFAGAGRKVFVKEIEKVRPGHGRVATLDEIYELSLYSYIPFEGRDGSKMARVSRDTRLFISEPLRLNTDGYGTIEHRCWVIENEPVAIARYGMPDDLDAPGPVVDFAEAFIRVHEKSLPPSYILDIGDSTMGLCTIELNNICDAGETTVDILERLRSAWLHRM